jgi:sporulation protein YlmC with PRC-barrel domain
MRTITWTSGAAIAVLGVAFLFAAPLKAQNTADKPSAGTQGGQARIEATHDFRLSQTIGMPVRNKNNENIGKIDDLVIDMKSGDVCYAALSFGGVAGIGSKLFAVPLQAMTFKFGDPNKANDRAFIFDVNKDQLDKSPGFDSSHWPDVADKQWSAGIDKHYNINRANTTVKESNATTPIAYETVFRASKIKSMKVKNDANQNLGSIDDLVINLPHGKVKYVALSYGSTLGLGGKLFAVPLSAMTLTHAQNETFLLVHVSEDALKNAPGSFDKDHWPNTADPNWAKEIDPYFQRTATRPATRQ